MRFKIQNIKKHYRAFCASVALALLVLSLRHLAYGIRQTTGSPELESWLMAIGIDLTMVAIEIAILAGICSMLARGILFSVLILSAGYNILAFLAHASSPMGQALAIALGLLVPLAIYGLVDTANRRPCVVPLRRRSLPVRFKSKISKLRAISN